jgi:NADPH-dependent curcumin reductase CurA
MDAVMVSAPRGIPVEVDAVSGTVLNTFVWRLKEDAATPAIGVTAV